MIRLSDGDSDDRRPCCPEELVKSNKLILRNTLICLVTFYCVYFSMAAFMHGAFQLDKSFDGREPFNFVSLSKLDFSTGSKESVASFLSLELTYFCTTLVISFYLLSRVWDYAITITVVHLLLSSAVMGRFPTLWQWWCGIGIGMLWMIIMGETISFFLRRRNARRIIGRSLNFPVAENPKQQDIPENT